MKRCVIITAYHSAPIHKYFDFHEGDFIVCADGGYIYAKKENIIPHVLIGDFDSLNLDSNSLSIPSSTEVVQLPVEKDDTDTMFCLKYGIEKGYDTFMVLGGLGGRLDHTMANLQTMNYAIEQEKEIQFIDGKNQATLRNPGSIEIKRKDDTKLSIFSYSDTCEGISLDGTKYLLTNYSLTNTFPLGVSNEFAKDTVKITHTKGKLLIILSQD